MSISIKKKYIRASQKVELAGLINMVCDNGYSLYVADTPESRLLKIHCSPPRVNGIQCSASYITKADNILLTNGGLICNQISQQQLII